VNAEAKNRVVQSKVGGTRQVEKVWWMRFAAHEGAPASLFFSPGENDYLRIWRHYSVDSWDNGFLVSARKG